MHILQVTKKYDAVHQLNCFNRIPYFVCWHMVYHKVLRILLLIEIKYLQFWDIKDYFKLFHTTNSNNALSTLFPPTTTTDWLSYLPFQWKHSFGNNEVRMPTIPADKCFLLENWTRKRGRNNPSIVGQLILLLYGRI